MGTFIAVGTTSVVARSDDGGVTWTDQRPASHTGKIFEWVEGDGFGNWMIAARQEIWKSVDDGLTFTSVTPPVPAMRWDYCCALAENTFLFVSTTGISPDLVYKTTDLGSTWADVTPDAGAALDLRNPATNGTGKVIIPHNNGSNDYHKYWLSTDFGDTWSEVQEYNGYSDAWYAQYINGQFVCPLRAPGMVWNATGLASSWSFKSHAGFYTGNSEQIGFITPYWFGDGQSTQFRMLFLSDDPTQEGDPGETRGMNSAASGDGVVIFVDFADTGDPVYSGIYSTTGSLVMTSRSPPAAHNLKTYNHIAFAEAAPPPAATTRSWVTWF